MECSTERSISQKIDYIIDQGKYTITGAVGGAGLVGETIGGTMPTLIGALIGAAVLTNIGINRENPNT